MSEVSFNITVSKPKIVSYLVSGRTLTDVKRILDSRDEWATYDATGSSANSAKTDASGKIVSITMVINPRIEMPAWSGYGAASKQQKASWDTMYKALLAHENKHHEIQLESVEELKKAVKAARQLDGAGLNKLIEQLRQSCQEKQDAFDTRTGHGARSGVVLRLDP